MNSDVVAVLHLEKNVVTVRILRAGNKIAFEYFTGFAGYSEETADLRASLRELVKDLTMISF